VKAFTDAEKAKWTAAWNTMSPEIKSAMAFFWASSERLVRRKADKLEAENIRLRAALEWIADSTVGDDWIDMRKHARETLGREDAE
jgi:hypothetical protein